MAAWLEIDHSLEGQFFPDTYQFQRGDTDLSILKRAQKRMDEVIYQNWLQRSVDDVLASPYEALILASIVEKEIEFYIEEKKNSTTTVQITDEMGKVVPSSFECDDKLNSKFEPICRKTFNLVVSKKEEFLVNRQ